MNFAMAAPGPSLWKVAMMSRVGGALLGGFRCGQQLEQRRLMRDQRPDPAGVPGGQREPVTAPPLEPNTWAGPAPRSSRIAATSSARSSGVESCAGSSMGLAPSPRGSYVTTVWSTARASATAANSDAVMGEPMTARTGPPPRTSYCSVAP